MTDTPEQIAAGLSEMEREWLLGWRGPAGAAFNCVARDLRAKGLLHSSTDWRLNSLGLAVRAILERTSNER